jgi:hypothetical protein
MRPGPLRCWLRRTVQFSDIAGASAAEPAQLTGDVRAWTHITGLDKGAGRGAGKDMERGMVWKARQRVSAAALRSVGTSR